MNVRWLRILLALAIVGPWASPAKAAPARGDATAERHLARGVKLLSENRDEEALDEFSKAYELEPSPKALAQVGLAEVSLQRWERAVGHLELALADGRGQPWIERNRQHLEEQLHKAEDHLGRVQIRGTRGAIVYRDGRRLGELPLDEPIVRVQEGATRLEARLPGHPPITRSVEVIAGKLADVMFTFQAVKPAPIAPAPVAMVAQPATPAANAPSTRPTLLASVALTSGVVTSAAGWMAMFNYSADKGRCNNISPCSARDLHLSLGVGATLAAIPALAGAGVALLHPNPDVIPRRFLLTATLFSGVAGVLSGWVLYDQKRPSRTWPEAVGMGVIAASGGALLLDFLMLFDPGEPPKKVALLASPGGLVVAGHF